MAFEALAAAKVAAPLLSLLGGSLKATETELIEDSFRTAIAEIRREDHRPEGARNSPGRVKRVFYKFFPERLPAGGRNGPDTTGIATGTERKQHKNEVRSVAGQLTRTLFAAPSDSADRDQPDHVPWTEALRRFLDAAGNEGIDSSNEEERRAWRWVVAGDPEKEPDDGAAAKWAARMGPRIAATWRAKIAGLVAHLAHEDDYELARVLADSSQRIARNLWRLVTVGIPLALAGGAAAALLVLYIDKG